ncbi:MAG: hypothetical protein PHS81_01215 [Candidatus Nanoarchaeia archaeon]|nr:hypothetical protein [Candidatus Nanoarchaeia archaeon]
MNCIKCPKKIYCSKLCKEHFEKYFLRKFKRHLSNLKILKRKDKVKLKGKNKKTAKHLLLSLENSLSIEFDIKGKELLTYSMDYKVISMLESMMSEIKIFQPSILECYRINEIEKFCKLKKIGFEEEKYSKLGKELKKGIDKLEKRKHNIFFSSKKMLDKLLEQHKKL